MSAREQLKGLADQMEVQSIEAHIKGAALCRRAAKLEQLTSVMTDAQTEKCLATLLSEGLVEMVNGKAKIVDGDSIAPDAMGITSAGGDA